MDFDEISHLESEDQGNSLFKGLPSYISGGNIFSLSGPIFQTARWDGPA